MQVDIKSINERGCVYTIPFQKVIYGKNRGKMIVLREEERCEGI